MLWTIAVVMLVLWALGLVTSYTMGGVIHVLLVVAIATVILQVVRGRRPICVKLKSCPADGVAVACRHGEDGGDRE